MACNVVHVALILTLLICGSINTLSTKWADRSKSCGLNEKDKSNCDRLYQHPFVQAVAMFMGEFLCFIAFWLQRLYFRVRNLEDNNPPVSKLKWFLLLPPAILDMIGTSIVYIALNLTTASSYQMLRGSVIIFTGLLSVAFIGRTIRRYMWVGMACITTGLILVGVGDFAFQDTGSSDYSENKLNGIVAGDLLIIMAQIVAAAQFVYEEKYIKKHSIPALLAVGLEGLFGMVILSLLLIPMYYIPASRPFSTDPENRLENVFDAFEQIKNNWHIVLATVGGILSIALFNFSGISITKEMSATTRMVIDSCRTIIIWVVSLSLVWQVFNYKSFLLQLLGFFFLFLGMIIYNDIFFRPLLKKYHLIKPRKPDPDDFEPGPAGERDNDEGSLAGDENPLIINAEDNMARRNILV